MTFDEAYWRMRSGAAIARPGWKKIDYLFWGHERVWMAYKDGRVRPLYWITHVFGEAMDWFIVEVESLPYIPPPKPQPLRIRTGSQRLGLSDRQLKMKQRWQKRKASPSTPGAREE